MPISSKCFYVEKIPINYIDFRLKLLGGIVIHMQSALFIYLRAKMTRGFEFFFCQFLNRCNEYNYTNLSLF